MSFQVTRKRIFLLSATALILAIIFAGAGSAAEQDSNV